MTTATIDRTTDVGTARESDVEGICDLLAASAPETIALERDEVRERLGRFRVVRGADGGVLAVAALHPVDGSRAELRSVAVDRRCRGQGLGRRLVERLAREVSDQGRLLFCFTFRPEFFRALGFRALSEAGLPRRAGRPDRLGDKRRCAMGFAPALPEVCTT